MGVTIFRPGQRLVIPSPGVQVWSPGVSVSFTGILDGISNVAAAYGLRKLRSAYAGSAVRVRRSSDSTEQDIGFNGTGEFDSAAFSAFVGGGTGYVKTWYDQSGNGHHMGQSITSPNRQPSIAISGINEKPSTIFNGAQFLNANYSIDISAQTTICVAKYSGAVAYQRIYTQTAPSATSDDYAGTSHYIPLLRDNTANVVASFASSAIRSAVSLSSNTYGVISGMHSGSALRNFVNGSPGSSYAHTLSRTFTWHQIGWGLTSISTELSFLTGGVCELIVFNVAISNADHNTIGTDMATRYGLSWTMVT